MLLEILLTEHRLLFTHLHCLSLRTGRRLIQTCPRSLLLAHIKRDWLNTWLIGLEIVVVNVIVVDNVCHILGRRSKSSLTDRLDLAAWWKWDLVKTTG